MSFYIKLKKFFQEHDPERIYMVKKIVRKFAANEDDVMARLEDVYASGGPSKLTSKAKHKTNNFDNSSSSNSSDSQISSDSLHESSASEPGKKSKKKLILIIIVAVVVLVGGYFGYGMFFNTSADDTHNTEETTHDTHANDEKDTHSEESHDTPQLIEEPEEENVLADSIETIDTNNVELVTDTLNNKEEEFIIEAVEVLDILGK